MHACISCAVPQDMADQGGDGGEGYGAGVSRSSSIRSVTAAASELLKRRQSLTGSPAGPAAGIDFDADHSVVLQQKLSQSAKPPARRPRSSTSSGISFCKPADRPPAADSLSQHGSLVCRQAAVSMSAGWGAAWQALALFVLHCSCVAWVSFGA